MKKSNSLQIAFHGRSTPTPQQKNIFFTIPPLSSGGPLSAVRITFWPSPPSYLFSPNPPTEPLGLDSGLPVNPREETLVFSLLLAAYFPESTPLPSLEPT